MIMKKKIAIYNLNTYPEMSGGSERSCLELAKELKENGEDVSVITLNPFKSGFSDFVYEGINIHKLPLLNLYWPTLKKKRSLILKAAWNVIDIFNIPMVLLLCIWLKKRHYNVVHTNNIKGASPWIFPMLKVFGFRVVHTTRDFYLLDNGSWYRDLSSEHNDIKTRIKRLNKLWCANFVDCAVFNSQYMKDYHTACGFFKKSDKKVIYNGFDSGKYFKSMESNVDIKTFGYIGRLSPEKGLDILFDNFVRFEPDLYKLVIAGATKDEFITAYPERESILNQRNDIVFIGTVDNTKFYEKVDCVIVPSKYNEPFGRVAMEAIFMGKPVIVSNSGGLPEQIVPGVHGVICSNDDYHSAMQEIIIKMQMLPSRDFKSPDLTKFTLNFSAKEYLAAYSEGK